MEYHVLMAEIYRMMVRGEEQLTVNELIRLREMVVVAERYEDGEIGIFPFDR